MIRFIILFCLLLSIKGGYADVQQKNPASKLSQEQLAALSIAVDRHYGRGRVYQLFPRSDVSLRLGTTTVSVLGLLTAAEAPKNELSFGECVLAVYERDSKNVAVIKQSETAAAAEYNSCKEYGRPLVYDINHDQFPDLIFPTLYWRARGPHHIGYVYEVYLGSPADPFLCFSNNASSAVSGRNIRLEKLSAKKRSLALGRLASSLFACST